MSGNRYIAAGLLFAFLIALLVFLTFSYGNGFYAGMPGDKDGSSENISEEGFDYSDNDRDIKADPDNAEIVEFKGEEIERYEIRKAGQYILKGSLVGNVRIDADKEIVHIILDGLSIKSDAGPAILVNSAGKVILTVSEGTENSFRDSTNYYEYKRSKACVYSDSDLTINGSGTLYVYGDYRGGIRTKDLLKVLDTDLNVRSKSDGIRGNDGVGFLSARVKIESEGSGILTDNSKNKKGNVEIEGGSVSITAGKYGIESVSDIKIRNCEDSIYGVLSDLKYGENVDRKGGS